MKAMLFSRLPGVMATILFCMAFAFAISCVLPLAKTANANEGMYGAAQIEPSSSKTGILPFMATFNAGMHDYMKYSSPVTSYLHVTDGNLERVEYVQGKLVVERVSDDFRHATSKRVIESATYAPSNLVEGNEVLWGGFFSGEAANYVVTGQDNADEVDDRVVIRVTKYSKNWEYLANYELCGGERRIARPFHCGLCSMAELNGMLYVRTSIWTYGGVRICPPGAQSIQQDSLYR